MHNKSFTADNQATIVGGRNVGDEYFGATDGVLFIDLDVLAIGPVVPEVSQDFDRYWTSSSAYPVQIPHLARRGRPSCSGWTLAATRIERNPRQPAYVQALRELDFMRQLLQQQAAHRMGTHHAPGQR